MREFQDLFGSLRPRLDRIALVGTSAPALVDLRATPVGEVYPGVEVHANLIARILDKTVKQRPAYTRGAEIILLLAVGVVLAFLVPFLTPLQATITSFGALAGVTALNVAVWTTAGLALPLASGLLMIIVMFALNMSHGYFVESRSKRQFTRDPKAPAQFINEYLTAMSLVIRGRRGTLEKYIGDAIMAFWGAPVADASTPDTRWRRPSRCRPSSRSSTSAFARRGGRRSASASASTPGR